MASSIQPLRINKSTPSSSPNKMSAPPTQRPLAEVGPMSQRRNSPSYNQATKKNAFQDESSPFDSSPFTSNSPRLYWQNRDPGSPARSNAENRSPHGDRGHSPSPAKRSSIENLKRASRVKNSSMFAREHKQEYDPTSSPSIERPLASGRPLSAQVHGNAFGGRGIEGVRTQNASENKEGVNQSPLRAAMQTNGILNASASPNKGQSSPMKSSLSSKSRYAHAQAFDPSTNIWDDEEEEEDSITDRQLPPGKSLHRHAKSVTFDAAPPEVNEYEMTTPDPSSVASGSRDGSHDSVDDEEDESFDRDDSFDASLEDTEKTPVVLPEDWRFMSPTVADENLASKVEDPFNGEVGSPSPTIRPLSATDAHGTPTRTDSSASDGERRPLPPLPALGLPLASKESSISNSGMCATVERSLSPERKAVSPPRPASISKAELQGMGGCTMPIEERLRLMMIQDDDPPKTANTAAEEQRERRLRRGSPVRSLEPEPGSTSIRAQGEAGENNEIADLGDYKMPPRISRESILRKVKGRHQQVEIEEEYSSMALSPTSGNDFLSDLDPDTPLPSTEVEVVEKEIVIKQEHDGEQSEVDIYSIPDLYGAHIEAESFMNAMEKLEAVKQSRTTAEDKDDDDDSHYSVDSKPADTQDKEADVADIEGLPTPRAASPNKSAAVSEGKQNQRMSLPDFAAFLGEKDFDFGMGSFMTDSLPVDAEPVKPITVSRPSWSSTPSIEHHPINEQFIERPETPGEQLERPKFSEEEETPQTPQSAIRHSFAEDSVPDSPIVPEPAATIKASGSKLKTRPSATPADIRVMAETRRQVSGEVPAVPVIHSKHLSRPSVVAEVNESMMDPYFDSKPVEPAEESVAHKQPKRKSSLVALDLLVEESDKQGLGIESEFDRVIEAQKKGYLMRQNTKVIVASSASHESATSTEEMQDNATRGTKSTGSSPRKASQTKVWTAEPWNGKMRRKSIRQSGGSPSKRLSMGPMPPLPGQESNVAAGLDSVNEDEAVLSTEEVGEDGERGRLFVKVVRVKDLDLPLTKGERSYFALTLDNGLHCVTTAWLELGRTAPIGQEFELVVLDDLEFQLTLQTKLEEPKAKPFTKSPTKTPKIMKPSTFSRVFASPRKRKEQELKAQEEAQKAERQRQQEAHANRRSMQPTAWDLLHNLVAKDGSFARSYVCLQDHEAHAYGKPFTVDVPCFNEWATEDANTNSVKSKRSVNNGGVQRKAPYKIGKLELQLLYVPKPKGAKDEDMPKSMNACIRELREAENASPKKWEGHLSQQGGDCPYWRRRFFTLDGSKFTAYHEATRQPRATINLAKASKLIDDKSALMRNDASPKKGGRRKSAFAEEEEGYMFVEEGFRMRFANGETIDFYADSAAEKDGWMVALAEVVGKDLNKNKTWTDLVLARQRHAVSRAKQLDHQVKTHSAKQAPPSSRSAPPTPAKNFPFKPAPPILEKSPRRSDVAQRRADASKTRSLVF